ncbi:MAG: serine/threonine-protein kinase bud32 [Pleopsidium flavum]|nr:MAG: serine/threonine-protein kinase bud32 [Pleopsidium flavum]
MTTPQQPPDITTKALPASSPPSLPTNFLRSEPRPTLITQGAEALLYRTTFLTPSTPCALKFRPSKPYRHPTLDARLTRHRILCEARVLTKCKREGVSVPAVYALDWDGGGGNHGGGWMMMEWVEGPTVRGVLDDWLKRQPKIDRPEGERASQEMEQAGLEREYELQSLMQRIGLAVAKMHHIGVVHGDLTTSNLMLRPVDPPSTVNETSTSDAISTPSTPRPSLDGDIVLIDFGLSAQNTQDEDKAVDLYVLERAFGSTHPRAEGLFREVLRAYGDSSKGAAVVLKRLEEVRMRGRKRSMIG